ncbi:MAG: S-methyl-5-thioribose-1-phosphate isomerase [Clostridiales bacterium]|nr:S-methyl-5-thioribose-1-phosphate isomerase [Clostridiales bacterium]
MEELINIRLGDQGDSLILIDQTKLPGELVYIEIKTREELFDAITKLKVRGAPAIGIAAAYGYYLCALKDIGEPDFFRRMDDAERYLASARPTAVNLTWALSRMRQALKRSALLPREEIPAILLAEANAILEEDIASNLKISEYGLSLLNEGNGVLTHCNAGPLATSRYGTALGPLLLAVERGVDIKVFADETRPLLQGARLTAFELQRAGADVTLICDDMAAEVMKEGKVNAVFVGCDRAAANGDAANKIGSLGLAVMAKHFGIPFYMFAPLSTVDMETKSGKDIRIEQRDPGEVTELMFPQRMAPEGVKVYNPAFDVVDHELIAGIVTEEGIIRAPFEENFKAAFERKKAREEK